MKTPQIAAIIALLLSLTACAGQAIAADITAVGGWSRNINASDLQAGAGSNLNATFESATNATLLTVSNVFFWHVDARMTTSSWNPNLVLSVKRNSGGSGWVWDGTDYTALSTMDTTLFQGLFGASNLPMQLRVSGVSITIPPGTYSTTITYTVVGN